MRMREWTTLAGAALLASAAAMPANAQFFFEPPALRGAVATGTEPGIIGPALPGATPDELSAAMVWNMRAALNVAALQCQFAPYLLTLSSYNQMLGDHSAELKSSYDTLTKYFLRTAKTKKEGQNALDQYGTRVYSSFSTVGAQLTFCQTAGEVSQAAVFVPRGSFATFASERLNEMRNSLKLAGEQRFRYSYQPRPVTVPSFDKKCWKKDVWQTRKCGVQTYGGA